MSAERRRLDRSRSSRRWRLAVLGYVTLCLGLTLCTVVTSARAYGLTGDTYWLFTRTHVLVDRPVQPSHATDSAMDALFEAAGDPLVEQVHESLFVLGMLDVTLPVAVIGGLLLVLWRRMSSMS
jgi:hypothetical protein